MKITNFTGLKKANRLKADISEIAYFFEEDKKQDFYNINLLDELWSNNLIFNDEYKQLTELFGRIRNDEKNTFLKPFLKGKHSARVRLTLENNSRYKTIYVASEVVRKFITPNFKKVVRKDKNVFNNHIDNLIVY